MNEPFAPRAPKAMALTLKYKEADEHVLRRLGQALVLHWDELPDTLQDLFIDQAAAVLDREEEKPHAGSDIETFIRKVKSVSLPSTPPTPQ
jgi:hypothetical protein